MKKKYIVLSVSVMLAIVLAIGGMIAYFTDTRTVTNTFTIGKVAITLTEPNWDSSNGENLVPGVTVQKDPTIKNTGANDAYLFAKVEVPCYNNDATPAVATDLFTLNNLDESKWNLVTDSVSNNVHTYIYAYANGSDVRNLTVVPPYSYDDTDPEHPVEVGKAVVFDSVTFTDNSTVISSAVSAAASAAQAGNDSPINIKVTAYAIQTTNVTGNSQQAIFNLFPNS